jgi:hypothetical protein
VVFPANQPYHSDSNPIAQPSDSGIVTSYGGKCWKFFHISRQRSPERHRLIILDKEDFPSGRPAGKKIVQSQYMGIGHVANIIGIPEVQSIADNVEHFSILDARMDRGYELAIIFTKDHRGP